MHQYSWSFTQLQYTTWGCAWRRTTDANYLKEDNWTYLFPLNRFYDAEGAGMKLCPVCNKSFPADLDESIFQEHQLEHLAIRLCPYCKMAKPDNMTDDQWARHVNAHYEDEDAQHNNVY